MRSIAALTIVVVFFISTVSLSAQSSTEGTEFWLAYQENLNLLFNDDPVFTIVVHTDAPTDGNILAPFTGASIPFSVPAGSTEIELFPAVLYPQGSDVTSNFGLQITTDLPARISAFHYRSFFCEASSVYPVSELGTQYRITTPTETANNNQPNSFVVAATEDNTIVEIIPSALTLGLLPAGVPINITLDAGQTYQVQSLGDLTNSSVSSSGAPLAVFAGARESFMDDNCFNGANSHVWDQVPPIDHFANLFYFVPFNNQNGDVVKILALEDNTEIQFNCEDEVTLNAGESYRIGLNQPTVISSTGPVSLTQYNTEGGCNAQNFGDPNGLNYLPAPLRSLNYNWFATDRERTLGSPTYFVEHSFTVIVPLSAQNDIELDGSTLSGFTAFPGDPNMVFLRQTVSGGQHSISSSSEPIQVFAYGFNEFDAYTQNLGYTTNEHIDFVCGCDPSIGSSQIIADIGCPNEITTFEFNTSYPELAAFYWIVEGDTLFDEIFVYEYIFENPGDYVIQVDVITIDGCVYPYDTLITVPDCTDPCFGFEPSPIFSGPDTACVDSIQQYFVTIQNTVGTIDSIIWEDVNLGIRLAGDTIDFLIPQVGIVDFLVRIYLDNGCVFEYNITGASVQDCSELCSGGRPEVDVFGVRQNCLGFRATFTAQIGNPITNLAGPPVWTSTTTGEMVEGFTVDTLYELAGVYPWSLSLTLINGCTYVYDSLWTVTMVDCGPQDSCVVAPEIELVLRNDLICTDSLLTLDLLLINSNGYVVDSIVYSTDDGQRFVGETWDDLVFRTPGVKNARAELYTTNGCLFADSLAFSVEVCPADTIIPIPSCSVYWPNAISPNLDGVNDDFRPFFAPACRLDNYLLRVFDRWGGELFVSEDPSIGWNGTARGQTVNSGVYLYVASYQLPDGAVQSVSGVVNVLR